MHACILQFRIAVFYVSKQLERDAEVWLAHIVLSEKRARAAVLL